MQRGARRAHHLAVDSQAIQARFGVMANGRVAEVSTAADHAVLALDEVHDYLVTACVVTVPPPSERWDCLLDQFRRKATAPDSALAGPLVDVGEHADEFTRELFVTAAAFLAAEANDLEDCVSSLAGDHRQRETSARLDNIVEKVGKVADALIGRVEDGTWQEFSENVPSIHADVPAAGRLPGGSGSSQLGEARQSTRLRNMQVAARRAWPAPVGMGVGVVITLFSENLWRDVSQIYVIILVAVLLICLGLLLGFGLHTSGIDQKYRRHAQRARYLNEREAAIARREDGGHPAAICESCLLEIQSAELVTSIGYR